MHPELRGWVDVQRTHQANVRLGLTLAFVAGAINAGGFLAVGQYTSHMTGVVSSVADQMVLGHWDLVPAGLAALLAFVLGAMTTAWMVNWGLRRGLHSAFGLPLLIEALALLLFGLFGAVIDLMDTWFLPLTVVLLCFIMGLQNAVITKISRAEIRTTHLTGLVTDLGLELGKLLYVNRHPEHTPVRANRDKLRLQSRLVGGFFIGALAGAWGFKHLGYVSTLPLTGLLLLLVWRPLWADLRRRQA
ncbi:YoaK family protein [Macromonas nakdongensis]|uniref:YoaK family protein n=1 Tax=Macromonas nakdongensis TaxID=1843082 RepID=UPI000C328642|nr:YoaK family protein [Macromonas nakdongensis]